MSATTAWITYVKPGDVLVVVERARLWPMSVWYSSSDDDDTLIAVTPMLAPGDVCGIIDTLDGKNGHVYAALVVCSEGIGCILTDDHFKPL